MAQYSIQFEMKKHYLHSTMPNLVSRSFSNGRWCWQTSTCQETCRQWPKPVTRDNASTAVECAQPPASSSCDVKLKNGQHIACLKAQLLRCVRHITEQCLSSQHFFLPLLLCLSCTLHFTTCSSHKKHYLQSLTVTAAQEKSL